jgi:hypothetical protein
VLRVEDRLCGAGTSGGAALSDEEAVDEPRERLE